MKQFAVCLVIALSMIMPTNASIRFGSREAAIETTGGTFDFINNATLSKGTLRALGSGSFTNDASEYLLCSKMKMQTKYDVTKKGMHVDGKLYLNDGTLTLENNDLLEVHGGEVAQAITVQASSSASAILHGYGSFANDITLADEGWLKVRWQSPLNVNINLAGDSSNGTAIWLEDDLWFAHGKGPQATVADVTGNYVECGAGGKYYMHIGGCTLGPNEQRWSSARISLFDDVTISGTVTLISGTGKIEGHGNKIIFSGSGGIAGSVNVEFSNITLSNMSASCLSGSATLYSFTNCVLDDGTNQIRIIEGAIREANLDNSHNPFSNDIGWPVASSIELIKDLNLTHKWLFARDSFLSGNGQTITFSDSTGIIDYNGSLSLSDVVLKNVTSTSFDNGQSEDLFLRNVEWHDGTGKGAIRIQPQTGRHWATMSLKSIDTSAGDIFSNEVTWNIGARLELLKNSALSGSWNFHLASSFNGNNRVLRFESGGSIDYNQDLTLSNIVLGNVGASDFNNADDNDLYLSNVTWVDDATQSVIRIAGNTEDATSNAAQVGLVASASAGNLYGSAVNWKNGVNLELLSTVTFGVNGAWTFTQDSIINGNGNVLDLNSVSGTDPITVASGKTLTISDTIIKGWGNSDITFAGATIKLVNSAIVLDNDVTLASNEHIIIEGNVRFITGSNVFDATAADSNNIIDGMTVWYDTLGTLDRVNLRMGSFSGGGRIAMMPLSEWADLTFDSGAPHVHQSLHLLYDVDVLSDAVYEALGRQITFDNSSTFTLRGNGRTFFMGKAPISSQTNAVGSQLITVSGSASNVVQVHDLTLDGWSLSHITDTNDLIRYAQGCIIRLSADESPTGDIYFSHDGSSEQIVLDLNGHALDLSSDTASLKVADTDATLTIKNGRILNLSDQTGGGHKIDALGNSSKIVFKDVDLVLAGNTTFSGNNIEFQGDCTITGTGRTDSASSPTTFKATFADNDITIASDGCLKVGKGIAMVLDSYSSSTDSSLTFGSRNATLFLSGATLKVSDLSEAPAFTHGTIRIDDVVTLVGDMTMGGAESSKELELDLMPAASIEVASGTVTYANAS